MVLSVIPDWIFRLTLQQQVVLLLCTRGPDGMEKESAAKVILRAYRACVFKAAHYGRMLEADEEAGDFMNMKTLMDPTAWTASVRIYLQDYDQYNMHFFTHLMHGSEVLAYKHPAAIIRASWSFFYVKCCDTMHVNPESEEQLDLRLNDFGRRRE